MKAVPLMISSLLLAFGAVVCLSAAEPSDWPQWRGPQRDGTVSSDAQWPEALDKGRLMELWRVELQPSYSGPIVVGDQVFVTETRDKEYEVVSALDRNTGDVLWETKWEGAMSVPFFARANGSWIRSTPAYDDGILYVGGIRDVLVALDAETGKILWELDCVDAFDSKLPSFGFVCSPLIRGPHLFVQAGGGVLKLDKKTGELIWRSLDDGGGMMGSAFSSPYVANLAGREQLLVQTRTRLAGLDLETGEELWSEEIPAFRGMNIVTPTTYQDLVLTSSYGGQTLAFTVVNEGDEQLASEEWANKIQGYMSSPVIIGDHLYLHLRNQRFASIDLRTGETNWTSTPYGKYWSMVVNGDKILALDERGELLLIAANPDAFELLGSCEVSDQETWAHLAVSDNQVFIRELEGLVAYRWE
ncbi:MAG: PQQ-binding-like beta-propeller repeat protein [Planctomycetota bacterium]